jgi:hypothetical protein
MSPLAPGGSRCSLNRRIEDESDGWSVVREPEGSWWYVANTDIFPRAGGILRVNLGDQITDQNVLDQCERYFSWMMKEGDRVRVTRTGVTGVIKDFGSLLGVPKTISVAYEGGGGCNHKPEEQILSRDLLLPDCFLSCLKNHLLTLGGKRTELFVTALTLK